MRSPIPQLIFTHADGDVESDRHAGGNIDKADENLGEFGWDDLFDFDRYYEV